MENILGISMFTNVEFKFLSYGSTVTFTTVLHCSIKKRIFGERLILDLLPPSVSLPYSAFCS